MESLQHFSHDHLLSLIHLQKNKNNLNSDDDEEEEKEKDDVDLVVEDPHVGQCNMCKEEIYSFHLCCYKCNDCDYMLHKYCAELPTTEKNHPLHPGHDLTLSQECQFHDSDLDFDITTTDSPWNCFICTRTHEMFYNYHYSICKFSMDIICATASQQKIDHPSHPHPLQRINKPILSRCNACGYDHKGTFYQCTTCFWFMIHLDRALLPAKLPIQKFTDFSHSHLLTLAYSFPYDEAKSKFLPLCKVCAEKIKVHYSKWLYKCDKCRYYVHVDCATSKKEPFMSIFMPPGLGKTVKNYKDEDYPNLLKCPFPDESCDLIKHHFINQKDRFMKGNNERRLNHESHPHQLIRFDTDSSLREKSVSLHDPMKRSQLLCDGCAKPVTTLPFYKCSQSCDFVLHEWCVRLPSEIQNHPFHPNHTLALLPKIDGWLADVFRCDICSLVSNGFVYVCRECDDFCIDNNCAFIPEKITHEAHPNHLLSTINASVKSCMACEWRFDNYRKGFHCQSCDVYLHTQCALLLPRMILHRFDKQHPLTLRYEPAENHLSEYICEICEEQMSEKKWFYHCTTCAESMHTACAPIKHECKQAIIRKEMYPVFDFINVKFGGTHEIESHPHRVSFIQGTTYHGCCERCGETIESDEMIFKCLECKFAIHCKCFGWRRSSKRIWN